MRRGVGGDLMGQCAVRPSGKVGDLSSFTYLELEDMGFGVLVCIVKAGLANRQQQQQKAPQKIRKTTKLCKINPSHSQSHAIVHTPGIYYTSKHVTMCTQKEV